MSATNGELSVKLASGGALRPTGFKEVMVSWYEKAKGNMAALCSSKEEAQKLFVAAMGHITRSKDLMKCSPDSLQNCIMQSATLKLYPGALQECAYVSYGQAATFIPQYQGLIKLSMQSGFLLDISAEVICEGDEFDYAEGTQAYLNHKRAFRERGEVIGAYAIAKLRSGVTKFEIMSKEEIEKIKGRSKSASSSYSPWSTDYNEMAKKTVIKRLLKTLPKSTTLAEALESEVRAEIGEPPAKPIIDVSDISTELSTEEVTNVSNA